MRTIKLTAIVTLESLNGQTEVGTNVSMKLTKHGGDVRFKFKRESPAVTQKIINY